MGAGCSFLPASIILCIIGCIVIPSRIYVYYYLPLAVFGIFGFIEFCQLSQDKTCFKFHFLRLIPLMTACITMVLYGSNSYFLLQTSKYELPQVQFANIINQKENPSVLNYGCLDTGIYTIAGVEPPTKFFCLLNLENYDEMYDTQQNMVENQEVDFLVIRTGSATPLDIQGYEPVAYKSLDQIDMIQHFHLYQKKEKNSP